MRKSPGKWIKTLLLGKKSFKSRSSKGKSSVENAEGPVISEPISISTDPSETKSREVKAEVICGGNESFPDKEDHDQAVSVTKDSNYSERSREEQAATKAQSVFRGYLARRAFRALKGIIRLQAVIRGHLVRRQAVATLKCTWGIVRLQMFVHNKKFNQMSDLQDLTIMRSFWSIRSSLLGDNSVNAFIRKIVSFSASAKPLKIQFHRRDPNEALTWIERWTFSKFWKLPPQLEKHVGTKSAESVRIRPKLSVRRNFGPKKASSPTTHENSESELEKVKRSLRKVSSASGQQHTSKKENVSDTVIRDSTNRKVDPIRDSDSGSTDQEQGKCWSVEDNSFGNNGAVTSQEKTSVNHRRARRVNAQYEDHSGSPDPEQVKDWSIEDYMNGDGGVLTSGGKPTVDCRRAKILNTKAEVYAGSPDLVQVKDGFVEDYINGNKGALSSDNKSSVEIKEARKVKVKTADYSGSADQKQVKDRSLESTQGEEEGMICISGALTSEEKPTIDHQRGSKRRASFPVRPEQVENGLQNTPVVPSYMASTQSAKAKFYGHASDGIEKASLIRRHSLPSGKLTSVSPRTQRAAQPSCKTGVREKLVPVAWKR